MPPKSPEDIIQAVYDATQEAIRTTVQLILQGDVTIDSVKLADPDSPARLKIRPDATGENGAVVILNKQPLPDGAATEAKQDALLLKDFATELTLKAILAKLITAPSTEAKQDLLLSKDFATQTTLAQILNKLISTPATEAKQDALLLKDFATEVTLAKIWNRFFTSPPATEATLAAILAKLITSPATEAKQDLLIAKDFSTETTLQSVLNKITALAATEAKQDAIISSLVGGQREHREKPTVSTSYSAASNSISFASPKKHVRIYCEEDMYWVDSAISDADAGARLTTAGQRGFIKRGDKLELSFFTGITRLDFLAVDTAGAVYVTGLE